METCSQKDQNSELSSAYGGSQTTVTENPNTNICSSSQSDNLNSENETQSTSTSPLESKNDEIEFDVQEFCKLALEGHDDSYN